LKFYILIFNRYLCQDSCAAGIQPLTDPKGATFLLLVPVDAIIVEEDSQRLMTGFNKLQRVRTVVTDRHRMSIRQGENWGEFYNLQSDPTEVNNLFDEASAEQIRATLTETMLGQIIELQGWAPLLAYRALVPPGCCQANENSHRIVSAA